MARKRNTITSGKRYRIRVNPNMRRLTPNDPILIRKKEEAIKSLTETPLPAWVFNGRLEDLKD